jgi:hypothetical protein
VNLNDGRRRKIKPPCGKKFIIPKLEARKGR